MKNKYKLFYLPSILLVIAYILKLISFPNQLLFIAAAFLLIVIALCRFLFNEVKKEKRLSNKVLHVLFFVLIVIILILPFVNMFSQGIIPIIIYITMVLSVFVYFFKINSDNKTISKWIRPNNYRNFVFQILILVFLISPINEVIPDRFYSPSIISEYKPEKGPEVFIDEAHHNMHTANGLYTTFSNILKQDGYKVNPFSHHFTFENLQPIKILVISNALNNKNINNWQKPIYSAFDEKEIQILKDWVENGGSLFLIADHMPFSSASKQLAAKFGFTFTDGFALQNIKGKDDLFCRHNNMILDNEITKGRNTSEFVDSILTFTGQAFKIPDSAKSILNFNNNFVLYSPEIAWDFTNCKPEDITGYSQGAYMKYGKGKIVVFGEAAMFSGQLGGGLSWIKIGLNSSKAKNNYKLLLNIMHWLD